MIILPRTYATVPLFANNENVEIHRNSDIAISDMNNIIDFLFPINCDIIIIINTKDKVKFSCL